MARVRVAVSDLRDSLRDMKRQLRERLPEAAEAVVRPKRLEKMAEGTTRVSQVMALLFIGPVIVVSLALIVVLNQLMTDVFTNGAWTNGDAQFLMFQWLITAMTLGAFVLAAWGWFQFVRTSGFGFFSWSEP